MKRHFVWRLLAQRTDSRTDGRLGWRNELPPFVPSDTTFTTVLWSFKPEPVCLSGEPSWAQSGCDPVSWRGENATLGVLITANQNHPMYLSSTSCPTVTSRFVGSYVCVWWGDSLTSALEVSYHSNHCEEEKFSPLTDFVTQEATEKQYSKPGRGDQEENRSQPPAPFVSNARSCTLPYFLFFLRNSQSLVSPAVNSRGTTQYLSLIGIRSS